jgi:hypothetical protein
MGNAFRAWFVVPWLWVCSSTAFVPCLFADEVVSPEALYDTSRALIIGIEHYQLDAGKQRALERC